MTFRNINMRPEDRNLHRLWRGLVSNTLAASPALAEAKSRSSHSYQAPSWTMDYKEEKDEDTRRDAELGYSRQTATSTARPGGTRTYFSLAVLSALGLSFYYLFARSPHFGPCGSAVKLVHGTTEDVCPQASAVSPVKNSALLDALEAEFQTEDFKLKAFESLGGAVRVPCVSHLSLATPIALHIRPGLWHTMTLHRLDRTSAGRSSESSMNTLSSGSHWCTLHTLYLWKTCLVCRHSTLSKTHVNKYALVYHWQGSDTSLKPALLTAHQGEYIDVPHQVVTPTLPHLDVVPVEPSTVDAWTHPPFSGYFDGESAPIREESRR